MSDQAEQLRNLVREMNQKIAADCQHRVVSVISGQVRTGVTTIALNLSIALARRNHPVVLVDLNFDNPQVTQQCRLRLRNSLRNTSLEHIQVNELLHSGPCGVQVFPAAQILASSESGELILESLNQLRKSYHVILDTGFLKEDETVGSLYFPLVDDFLVVTDSESEGIIHAYSKIKMLCQQCKDAKFYSIVNRTNCELEAKDVHERIVQSSDRFLNLHVNALGTIFEDPLISRAATIFRPLMLFAPHSEAAHQVNDLAENFELRMRRLRAAA